MDETAKRATSQYNMKLGLNTIQRLKRAADSGAARHAT